MEKIHELSNYYLLAFLVVHVGGVFIFEMTDNQGLVSRMVSGKKKK